MMPLRIGCSSRSTAGYRRKTSKTGVVASLAARGRRRPDRRPRPDVAKFVDVAHSRRLAWANPNLMANPDRTRIAVRPGDLAGRVGGPSRAAESGPSRRTEAERGVGTRKSITLRGPHADNGDRWLRRAQQRRPCQRTVRAMDVVVLDGLPQHRLQGGTPQD